MRSCSRTRTVTRPVIFGGLALAGALTLSACGGSSSTATVQAGSSASASSYGPAAAGPHNAADVTFASDMVPHHSEAVQMADMALQQGSDAQVKQLATAIKGGQDPEIKTMDGWLAGWGQPVPKGGSMTGMGGASMPGMMSDAENQQLSSANGPAFDRLWVMLMTKHHKGALTMAQTELRDGQNPEAKALAGKIIAQQTGEIATMAKLMQSLPT